MFAQVDIDRVGSDAGIVEAFRIVQVLGLDLHQMGIKGQGFDALHIAPDQDGVGNKTAVAVEGGIDDPCGAGAAHGGGVLDVTNLHQRAGVTDGDAGKVPPDSGQVAHRQTNGTVGAELAGVEDTVIVDVFVNSHAAAVFTATGFCRAAQAVAKAAVDGLDSQGVGTVNLFLSGGEISLVSHQADGAVAAAEKAGNQIEIGPGCAQDDIHNPATGGQIVDGQIIQFPQDDIAAGAGKAQIDGLDFGMQSSAGIDKLDRVQGQVGNVINFRNGALLGNNTDSV
ncbi:hypothetical protein DSCOOX_48730 [Desulfosarcina ovata subsp. ovata]|uniref:Uncharacterized protein n=1 Tax=Desulfosarcina ovata subsp. ovata TaxID=2752305 RepID=A0A5K8AG76_9BACT|nr:hypothetical protein DSCOOX_48730 [Desulfosarcina ovata subsp. ovata]